MPRKTQPMTSRLDELDESERAELDRIRQITISIGRAIGLSCVAAGANERMEDHAIAAADAQWSLVADRLVEFAMGDD